jgi:hypothetical protein
VTLQASTFQSKPSARARRSSARYTDGIKGVNLTSKKIKVIKETRSQSYGELYIAYVNLMNMSKQFDEFISYELKLAALVMLCFSIEAFTNHIGEAIVEEWEKKTRGASPLIKLKILQKKLKIPMESDKDPFLGVASIMRWRNSVAHARSKEWYSEFEVDKGKEMEVQWNAENIEWKEFVFKTDIQDAGMKCKQVMAPIHQKCYGSMERFLTATSEHSDTIE